MNPALDILIAAVDRQPTVAQYGAAARELEGATVGLRPLRVALLATFTIDPLVPFVKVEAARRGFDAGVYVGQFDSVNQELLDPGSGLARYEPDVVFVTQLVGDMCAPLADDFLGLRSETVDQLIDDAIATMERAWRAFRDRSTATIVVSNFSVPGPPMLGFYEATADKSQACAIRHLNARLAAAARSFPGVYVHDLDGLSARAGQDRWRDERMWLLARAPLSATALPRLAASYAGFMRALFGAPKKCLVLDLDNTLWGGIVGEQGPGGITLGPTYPGNDYRDFQRRLLSLYRRGVLLAINSKNNPSDVDAVFTSNAEMVLKPEHFSATRINWRDKAENMIEIAAELGIGLDSCVFFDDSAAECARIRQVLPEVLTIQAPVDVSKCFDVLMRDAPFDRLSLTDEDRRRTEMYREQAERTRAAESGGSVMEFLQSLEMAAEIKAVDQLTLPRAVELSQKTNQFNLTTRRYTAGEMAAAAASPDCAVLSLRLLDRFGDNGVVGLAVTRAVEKRGVIEAFLMSCRVIGREAETAMLAAVVQWARTRGLREIDGAFVPTPKNAPAADFFERHGFSRVEATERASTWRFDIVNNEVSWPTCIRALNPSLTS